MIYKKMSLIVFSLILVLCSCGQGPQNYSSVELVKSSIIASTNKVWRTGDTLTIAFLDGDLKTKKLVELFSKEWTKYANINFDFYESVDQVPLNKTIDITISFKLHGNTSAVGTDSRYNITNQKKTASMSLSDLKESRALMRFIVLHEFGHALGLEHEHQHIKRNFSLDEAKTKEYYSKTFGFSEKETQDFILSTKPTGKDTYFSVYDPNSVMHYTFHSSVSMGNIDFRDNFTLSLLDKVEISKLYPGRMTEEEVIKSHNFNLEVSSKLGVVGNCQIKDYLVEKMRLNKDNKPELIKVKFYKASSIIPAEFESLYHYEDKDVLIDYLKNVDYCNYSPDELEDLRSKKLSENMAQRKFGNCEIPLTKEGLPVQNNCPTDFQYQILKLSDNKRVVNSCFQSFDQVLGQMKNLPYCKLSKNDLAELEKRESAAFEASLRRGKCQVENIEKSKLALLSRCNKDMPWFISFDQSKLLNRSCYSSSNMPIDEINNNSACN